MNRISYLEHSGFAVTLPSVILVFDYTRDPSHTLHRVLEQNPDKPVVFFVSHNNGTHYNKSIYELAQNHRRVYVLANEVPARDVPSDLAVQGMSAGDYVEGLPHIKGVKAYKSNDKGVCYYVATEDGPTIFHAGDLNERAPKNPESAKEEAKADVEFTKTINRIAEEHPEIDVAMFPVDVREGNDFARGARYFLEKVKVNDFFPMHFDGDYREACNGESYLSPGTTLHCLHEPGQSIDLSKR